MGLVQVELIQSPPFVIGNASDVRMAHQQTVNTFLATITPAYDVLQLQTRMTPCDKYDTQYVYVTVVTYYTP